MLQRSLTRPFSSRGFRVEVSRITRYAPRYTSHVPRRAAMPAALPIRRDFGTSPVKHGSDQPEKQSIIDKLSLDGKVTVVTGRVSVAPLMKGVQAADHASMSRGCQGHRTCSC